MSSDETKFDFGLCVIIFARRWLSHVLPSSFVFFSASYNTRLWAKISACLREWRTGVPLRNNEEIILCYYYCWRKMVEQRSFKRELFLTAIYNNWEDIVRKLLDNNGPEIFRKKTDRGLERIP